MPGGKAGTGGIVSGRNRERRGAKGDEERSVDGVHLGDDTPRGCHLVCIGPMRSGAAAPPLRGSRPRLGQYRFKHLGHVHTLEQRRKLA